MSARPTCLPPACSVREHLANAAQILEQPNGQLGAAELDAIRVRLGRALAVLDARGIRGDGLRDMDITA